MTRRISLTLIAALFVAAASAQEAVTIKFKERGEGESVLITKIEAGTFSLTIVDAKGKILSEQKDKSADIKEYKETVLKREGAKPATKLEREYSKAQSTKGGTTHDWPVVGKTIVAEKKAGKYTFAFKGGDDLAGPFADALVKEFSRKGETDNEFEKLMLPKTAVKPGEKWALDMAPVVKDLGKGGEVEVVAAGAIGVGRLVETYLKDGRQFGKMEYRLEVPIKALGKGTGQVKFLDGAKISIDMSMDMCIDGTLEVGTMRSRISTAGNATLPKVPGAIATLNIVNDLVQIHAAPAKK